MKAKSMAKTERGWRNGSGDDEIGSEDGGTVARLGVRGRDGGTWGIDRRMGAMMEEEERE